MDKFTCVIEQNPIEDRAEWLRLRKQGFGGSDIGTLYEQKNGLDGFGCARFLIFSKVFDVPEETNSNIERGKFLEEPVANLFQEKCSHPILKIGRAYIKEHPYIYANADRISHVNEERVLIEIKCPSRNTFRKYKMNGLPMSYICQGQWQMLCYGVSRMIFVVYCADTHEMETFPLDRDEVLIKELMRISGSASNEMLAIRHLGLKEAMQFLKPLCKDPEGCDKCERIPESGIQAVAPEKGLVPLNSIIDSVISDFLTTKEEIKKLEELESSLKEEIIAALEGKEKGASDSFKISYGEQSRESVSVAAVKAAMGEKANDIIVRSKFNVLRATKRKD